MHKGRLEAFSDGVIAIILTIMVLELKAPKEDTPAALLALWPVWAAYALSYYNVFVIWLDHSELCGRLHEVDRPLLVANGLLLFAASLIPFATAYAGDSHWQSPLASSLYGLVMAAVSLAFRRLRGHAAALATDEPARRRLQRDAALSGKLALLFIVAAAVGPIRPQAALLLFAVIPVVMRARHRRQAAASG